MGYEIFDLTQKAQWDDVMERSCSYDFYHTWQYHSVSKEGDPFLFLFRDKNDFVAFPLIKRRIKNSNLFDLTSAYGFVGPISNRKFDESDEPFLERLKQNFLRFLNDHRIVSLFSRLHPIITQHIILKKFGGVFLSGKTVAIDLAKSIEEQRSKYRADHFNGINIMREKGFYCREMDDAKDIDIFISIYYENMRRVNALPEYFFDKEYFNALLHSDRFNTRIFLAYIKEKPVAGGLFTFTNDVIQVHLLSTRNKYLYYSPAKLLVDEVSLIGRAENMRYMHLGGGYGGKYDSLFGWKAGFSDMHFDFYTWRYINSNDVYNDLVADAVHGQEVADCDYFPLYRKIFA